LFLQLECCSRAAAEGRRYVAFSGARTNLMNRFLIIAACLLLVAANSTFAKSWRGIVPLHSTRDDVRKLLGKPSRHGDYYDHYALPRYSVGINYAMENIFNPGDDCDGPAPYWWGDYHVSVGTVLSVEVSFDRDIPLAKLKIPSFNKLTKGEPDSTLSIDYFDAQRGVQYSIRNKRIQTISYGPSAVADAGLRCTPDPEADARETRVNQICSQLFGPMIDRHIGLYAINPFYVLSLTFDRHGELISLRVEPKYYYDWIHIDWEGRDEFPRLSTVEYESVLSRIDHIKPRGPLVQSVTINSSSWREQTYRDAVVEWDEVGNPSEPDASKLVRWFTVFYVKRRAI
jgi:hypothetical protein